MSARLRLTGLVTAATAVIASTSLTAAAVAAGAAPPPSGGGLVSQDLAAAGVGSPFYRIPALTTTNRGTVLASYDARPTLADLPSNIHIVLRRSTDNGRSWREQRVVRQDPAPQGYGDPSLLVDRITGRIFIFYAAGQNQGFQGSATGNDENDPNILQTDYSYSDDDGLTWTHRRITKQIKDPAWGGIFAASGEGIQIRRGPHAGRLVQQYVVRFQGGNYAASAYSDDHGATWRMGQLLGPGMDENKSVELSDGRLMLNSRARPFRKVAFSSDGGQTWTGLHDDPNLIDPANNASIMRYDLAAAPGSERANWLLFTNAESTTSRTNLVVKQSCDNGQTWPIRKVVEPGSAAYSTLTRLSDGTFGLLWERQSNERITFSRFPASWLGGVCAPLSATAPTTAEAGTTTSVSVRIANQERRTLTGSVTLTDLASGWTAGKVAVRSLRSGGSTTVEVPLQIPAAAPTNGYPLRAVFRTEQGSSTTPTATQIVVDGGNLVWEDTTARSYDGTSLTDVSERFGELKDLTGGAVAVRFSTTATAAAAALISSADPISQVRDLVLSLNNGRPFVEFRSGASEFPIRIVTDVPVNDGQPHELVFASNGGRTSLILDGRVIGQASAQRFFKDVDDMTPVHELNPTGLPNLTIGGNRAYVTPPGALTDRWFYAGAIESVRIFDDRPPR